VKILNHCRKISPEIPKRVLLAQTKKNKLGYLAGIDRLPI
jgi:hypothetical protein